MNISSSTTRTAAAAFLAGGTAMLFVPDVLLPALVPGFPSAGFWLGQVLGAAWLGLAALNWLQRDVVLGGIYGRPVVFANLGAWFITALVSFKALPDPAVSWGLWLLAGVSALLALAYAALLLRGPFDAPS